MPLNDAELAKVRSHLGIADLSADTALDTLLRGGEAALEAATVATEAAEQLQTSLSRAEAERDEAKAQIISLSRGSDHKPTATELYWANKTLSLSRESAILSGAITPADAADIEKQLIGTPIDPSTISLSREVQPEDGKALAGMTTAATVFEVLAKGRKAPKPGEALYSFSREVPGTEGEANKPARVDPYADTIARLTAAAK